MTAKRTARLVLSLLAGLLLAGTVTTTAQAEDGYRFWGYYQWSNGQWAFAQKGADVTVPADGSVEGWRYALGGAKPRLPRAAGDFETICGATAAETGKKRVAVVIDSGTPADSVSGQAPPAATGTCVVTDPKATGAKVLAAVKPVRIEKGLTCGIAGYPATGCGDPVKNIQVPATDEPVQLEIGTPVGAANAPSPASAPTEQSDDGAPWTGIVIAAVVVLLLAGGGLVLSRRRTGQRT
ncbi:SCO2322 family protein [Kribbella sancticallisti]|uniref:SCO2322 family protein n=1 Tax=Kribbella sancticallisti TaxID=460087 RepID=A0ABN2CNV4_9ACTN